MESLPISGKGALTSGGQPCCLGLNVALWGVSLTAVEDAWCSPVADGQAFESKPYYPTIPCKGPSTRRLSHTMRQVLQNRHFPAKGTMHSPAFTHDEASSQRPTVPKNGTMHSPAVTHDEAHSAKPTIPQNQQFPTKHSPAFTHDDAVSDNS
jgi:hypothetical protein